MYSHNCKANRLRKYSVLTNGPVFTGWQGYGNPEVFFLIESAMDDAAEKLGIDPVELRRINHMREGDNYLGLHYRYTGPHWLGHTGLDQCLDKGAELVKWHERRPASEKTGILRHGKGVAVAAQQNCGEGVYAAALVKLDSDGTATLINNYMDIGQGGRTAQIKIVADVLGLPMVLSRRGQFLPLQDERRQEVLCPGRRQSLPLHLQRGGRLFCGQPFRHGAGRGGL
jgi:xanthine dehydrogenase molybdenum-binding subunit